MKRTYVAAVVLLALLAAALYLYAGSQTPAGQPALQSLTVGNAGELKAEFNAEKNDVRVLLLLSPT